MNYRIGCTEKTLSAEVELPQGNQHYFLRICWWVMLFVLFSLPVAAQTPEAQLKQHINKELSAYSKQLGIRPTRQNIDIFMPKGIDNMPVCSTLQISRRPQTDAPLGRVSYSLNCTAPSPWQSRATARISLWADVVVASRTLERDEVLTTDMLNLKSLELSQIKHGLEFNTDALTGMKVRRRIQADQPVARHLLMNTYLVEQGSHVTIQVQQAGFQASVKGVALENGQAGQRIKVRNLTSGVVVEGIVIAENLVETDRKRN